METEKGKRGLHNWKNLFRKPKLQDIIIFLLLMMTLVNGFLYKRDIQACNDFYNDNLCELCGLKLEQTEGEESINLLEGNLTIGGRREEAP